MKGVQSVALVLAILIITPCCAQRLPGYIVLNSKDTLRGELKKPATRYMLHHKVNFRLKHERKQYRFKPDELQGFGIGNDVFESRYIWAGDVLVKKFLKPLVKGYCTLYEYYYTQESQKGMIGETVQVFFVQRNNEKLHRLDFRDLKKEKDSYLADSPALMEDIQNGKYSSGDLIEIITRYNQEKEKSINKNLQRPPSSRL